MCMLSMRFEPATKDHLCIRIIFGWSLGSSLYTSFIEYIYLQMTVSKILIDDIPVDQSVTDNSDKTQFHQWQYQFI